MYNRVILMGRLTRDPELRTTQNGVSYCRFSIAVDRAYKQGEDKQADFFDVTAWRQTAEFVSKWFSKGKCILVEGKLQNNNYTDNNGVKHYQNVIVADNVAFCGDKSGSNNQQPNGQTPLPQNQQAYQNQGYQQQGYQNQQYQQQYTQQPYQQQRQPAQQPYNQPQQSYNPPPQANQQQRPIDLGDLSDFEEILSDGDVPF